MNFKQLNKKETVMMEHYRSIIEIQQFDEYDILGFLIFIRPYVSEEQYPYIKDFAHLVAHRGRNKGKVMECINNAISNNYEVEIGSKAVKGYHGMLYEDWINEWFSLGNELNISFSDEIIKEITICIFSLSQGTEYNDKFGHSGKIELIQGNDNSLALATTEGDKDSLFICFSKIAPLAFEEKYMGGLVDEPVETVRVNSALRLRTSRGFII